jgi:hypothetical protein
VGDDFSHALGDPAEGGLAAALGYLFNQSCPAVVADSSGLSAARDPAATDGLTNKSPWRQNRILRR